jgi:hypothetical protein
VRRFTTVGTVGRGAFPHGADPRAHLIHRALHLDAGLVLRVQLLVDRGQLLGEMPKRAVLLSIRQFKPGVASRRSKPFDLSHGAVHRAELLLELRDEVELMGDEDFRIQLERAPMARTILRHTHQL